MECLWTFPAAGMGATSNSYRTAVPSVEVNEETGIATLYVYTGENGYGVYEFQGVAKGNKVNNVYNNAAVEVLVNNNTLRLSEEVAHVALFSITGQLIAEANNVRSIDVASKGVFVLKATTYAGEKAAHKVVVK